MNLSSLVHSGRHQAEHQHYSPQPTQPMSSSMIQSQYVSQPYSRSPYPYVTAPQPPPSPPVDETAKCSLPSISSLLGLADSPQDTQSQHTAPSSRPGSGHQQYGPSPPLSTRGTLPPTPPMHAESGYDGRQSPSAASTSGYSVASAPGYYFNPATSASALNNMEPHAQRQPAVAVARRLSISTSGSYTQSPYNNGQQYSPSQQSISSYYPSPMQPTPPQSQVSGMYYQRPLPQQFPPPLITVPITITPATGAMWQHQHHHYISPSSAASFPQSQDRYICQTCNKAFSRPSSLRIHSHSHTGEKPFICPHKGCSKAFSVRSNMKRHERGCHSGTFESAAII